MSLQAKSNVPDSLPHVYPHHMACDVNLGSSIRIMYYTIRSQPWHCVTAVIANPLQHLNNLGANKVIALRMNVAAR